jgi:uncharacterized protein YfaS (alpha-2-macroglobulin family)
MTVMNFAGQVSAEQGPGEAVTITITNPDGSNGVPLTAQTDAKGNFSASADLTPGSGYTAQASIGPDADYAAVQTDEVPFDVSLDTRTINLTVTQE